MHETMSVPVRVRKSPPQCAAVDAGAAGRRRSSALPADDAPPGGLPAALAGGLVFHLVSRGICLGLQMHSMHVKVDTEHLRQVR